MNENARRIIEHFGSLVNLAKSLNISRIAIYKWNTIPELRAYEIYELLEGKLSFSYIMKASFTDKVRNNKK